MRNLIFFLFFLLSSVVSVSAQDVVEWTPAQISAKLKTATPSVILDVRTQGEYSQGHLAKAVNMDVNAPGFDQKIQTLDKKKTIYVYCAAGVRSRKAAAILKQKGFNAVSMSGGIQSWTAAGLPVVK